MNLVRFNPALANIFDNIERNHAGMHNQSNCNMPSVNIIDNEKNFVLEVAAPGIDKNEFSIKVENNVLTISHEEKEEKEEKSENYTRREINSGSFCRSFTLPKNIKLDDINADYNQGILKVTLPKNEEVKLSREITIS
eukprot:Anaeramoba_flamelloidesa1337_303.p1 GENE.a1337_303~~a1337_303.p1  ORF type:complete len:138 (+),score=20.80 a1337_303:68-481(+)